MTLYATGTTAAGTPSFYEGPMIPDGFTEVSPEDYAAALATARDAATKVASELILPISRAQALIQLRRTPSAKAGRTLRQDVEDAVEAAGGDVQDWYELAGTWNRTNPYVGQLGTQLGLTAAQIDDLFRQAASIQA